MITTKFHNEKMGTMNALEYKKLWNEGKEVTVRIYISGIHFLVESIEKELGEHSECSPFPLFKGKLYNDTFVMHCDTLSYGTIGKFKEFINFFEKSDMKNCLIEGDRFTSEEWFG